MDQPSLLTSGSALPSDGTSPAAPLQSVTESVAQEAAGPRLRVGILVDSLSLPAWVARILRQIRDAPFCELVLVVVNESAPKGELPDRFARLRSLWRDRARLLYRVYSVLDRRLLRMEPDPFTPEDVRPLLDGVRILPVQPQQTKFRDRLSDEDVASVRDYSPDVLIRFGFRILSGAVLGAARYGVWSYHHGDNFVNRGGPPGFWEVADGNPVTGSVLQVLSEELDAGQVIYRSWSKTHRFSVTRNRTNYYWKSSAFLLRKLRDVHEQGPAALRDPEPERAEIPTYGERLYRNPTNSEMIGALVRIGGRFIAARTTQLTHRDQWMLLYHWSQQPPADPHDPATTLYRFKPIVPPRDRFWADPFPVEHAGRSWVFCEELLFATKKGRIALMEIGTDGPLGPPAVVLERDFHLSYPCVFRWNDQWWMTPESEANRTVDLYRATDFPYAWTQETRLLSGFRAVDATPVEIAGRWWMFVNIAVEGASPWEELHLYHASTPLGPWTPHRHNPIKSDVRGARPAGRPFQRGGRWYRPAQDCSVQYGHALVMHRIERLEPDYREVEVGRIQPRWAPGIVATHTLNAAGRLTMADAQRRVARFR